MSLWPCISVVTPVLNAASFISRCIASVGEQRYPAIEHIVVDGGSTDETIGLVRQFPQVNLIQLPGSNQSAAINAGFKLARGDVVAWLNADDSYAPGALEYVGRLFAAEPGLQGLYGDCTVLDLHDQVLWYETPGVYDFGRLLRNGNYLAQPAVFLRKSTLEQVGLLDESLQFGMDYDLWLRLRNRRIDYVPRVLADYRWHAGSKTAANQFGNWRELLLIVRRYGGGWTPQLVWSFLLMLLTVSRLRIVHSRPRRSRGLAGT